MSDDDSYLEQIHFKVFNIEEHTTQKGNECIKVHGQPTSENRDYTLWVFNDDWMEELRIREDDYLSEEFEVVIDDKTGGSRSHVWALTFWPTDEVEQKVWFDKYLKSRGSSLTRRTDEEVEEVYQQIGDKFRMVDDNEKKTGDSKQFQNQSIDRNTRIERQAAMHFASRIVAAKIQRGDSNIGTDEEITEEINKWKGKFQRGIYRGELE